MSGISDALARVHSVLARLDPSQEAGICYLYQFPTKAEARAAYQNFSKKANSLLNDFGLPKDIAADENSLPGYSLHLASIKGKAGGELTILITDMDMELNRLVVQELGKPTCQTSFGRPAFNSERFNSLYQLKS